MKRSLTCLALAMSLTGCTVVPLPIPIGGQVAVPSAETSSGDRLGRYVVWEEHSDSRLTPVLIEGIRSNQGNFMLHMVLKPISDVTEAGAALTCFGRQDTVLCSMGAGLHLDPDGNLSAYAETDVPFDQVEWFRVYWQAPDQPAANTEQVDDLGIPYTVTIPDELTLAEWTAYINPNGQLAFFGQIELAESSPELDSVPCIVRFYKGGELVGVEEIVNVGFRLDIERKSRFEHASRLSPDEVDRYELAFEVLR